MLSRAARLGVSVLLSLMLAGGLTSAAFGAPPTGSSTKAAALAGPAVPFFNITGTVTGTGAVALKGINVRASGPAYFTATTAADGTYSLAVSAGSYTLYFYQDPTGSYLHGYYSSSGFTVFQASSTPVVVTTSDVTGKNVQLGTGHLISGIVTRTGAVPLKAMQVEASISGYGQYASTAINGTYSIRVPDSNSYLLYFRDPLGAYLAGYYDSAASGHFTLLSGSATVVPVGTADVAGKDVQMVAAPPWSVSLGTSATSVTVGGSVTLTATASENVGPTSYFIVILDSANNVVLSCGGGITCVTSAANTVAGPQTYHAVIGKYDGTSPIVTSATRTVTWNPGLPTHMTVSGLASPRTAGTAGTITVAERDAYNNLVPGFHATIHFTSSDPAAVLPANYTFTTADGGVHTFSVTLKTTGTRSVTATNTAYASITGTQSGIVVN